MELRVLGPLEVRTGGVELALGSPKQQVVLALLVVNANRLVTLDELVDELWSAAPPASAVANVRTYAGSLRRLFGSVESDRDRLVHRGSGYVLRAEAEEVDLLRFAGLAAAGREELQRGEAKVAAARLAEALACWRGPMLAGLPRGSAQAARCAAVEDERLTVAEELSAAHLRLDEAQAAVELLREHLPLHPLRERGWLLLMRALYRLGDVTGALAAYAEARESLREQLGLEPGHELQALHQAILAREPDPASTASATGPSARVPASGPVPAQLPLDVFGFTGRADELAGLDALLNAVRDQPTAVVISAIAGTAGVGKTALAVHWAHRVREKFPDGQLYVNLRGFHPAAAPITPAEAVRRFLDAFAIPQARIPAELPAQIGLYRSLLANRRMLILLDNARDAEQVRPLLPGSPGCLVLVTSRNQLSGLVAAVGAHPFTLDLLTTTEARGLLARRLGADRVSAEPDAVDEIVVQCARLPLALTIMAARASAGPVRALATLAIELRDARSALDTLSTDEVVTDVRAVFSWSYRALSVPAARLFRLLGLHPGADIGLAAAASLAGLPKPQARPLLAELTRSHLITEPTPDRYTFHDLLRSYAAEQCAAVETDTERNDATHRMLDYYLQASRTAFSQRYPHSDLAASPAPRPGVAREEPTSDAWAATWFDAEHHNVHAAVARAAEAGLDTHAWQLGYFMAAFFVRRGYWPDWFAAIDIALEAAYRLDDRLAQARVHLTAASTLGTVGRFAEAHTHLAQAKTTYEELGDPFHLGRLTLSRVYLAHLQDHNSDGLALAHQALSLFRGSSGNRMWEARALEAIGWFEGKLGNREEAVRRLQQCAATQREISDRLGESGTLANLGAIYREMGRHSEALSCCRRGLELSRAIGDRPAEALGLSQLGDSHRALGDRDAARTAWEQALALLDELGHPEADRVREKLRDLRMTPLDGPDRATGTAG